MTAKPWNAMGVTVVVLSMIMIGFNAWRLSHAVDARRRQRFLVALLIFLIIAGIGFIAALNLGDFSHKIRFKPADGLL